MLKSIVTEKYGESDVAITENEHFELEAKIALDIMTKWGCVAAEPDGEDSSGRQQLKTMSEEALIERCFKAAKLFMERARGDKLIHICPSLPEKEEKDK
jgi:hypothetical protein